MKEKEKREENRRVCLELKKKRKEKEATDRRQEQKEKEHVTNQKRSALLCRMWVHDYATRYGFDTREVLKDPKEYTPP